MQHLTVLTTTVHCSKTKSAAHLSVEDAVFYILIMIYKPYLCEHFVFCPPTKTITDSKRVKLFDSFLMNLVLRNGSWGGFILSKTCN